MTHPAQNPLSEFVDEEMGGSESEALFDSLNLNPQRFINGSLNLVDELVEDAFAVYFQEALTAFKIEGTQRAQDLSKGVTHIGKLVQSALDKRLLAWEKYCHNHSFSLPQGFSLPTKDESLCDGLRWKDALNDSKLDEKLDSLRTKLFLVGKESSSLNRELQELESLVISRNSSVTILNETLRLYEQNVSDEMFQELMKTAEELRAKILKMKTGMGKTELIKFDKAYSSNQDLYPTIYRESLSNAMLEEMEEFVDNLKT